MWILSSQQNHMKMKSFFVLCLWYGVNFLKFHRQKARRVSKESGPTNQTPWSSVGGSPKTTHGGSPKKGCSEEHGRTYPPVVDWSLSVRCGEELLNWQSSKPFLKIAPQYGQVKLLIYCKDLKCLLTVRMDSLLPFCGFLPYSLLSQLTELCFLTNN